MSEAHPHQDEDHDLHEHDEHKHDDHEHDEHDHDEHGHEHDDHDEHGHEHEHDDHEHEHRRGVLGALLGAFSAHSHDPGDQVDSALEGSARGMVALRRSLIALALTAALQGAVVVASHSIALLGDTLHNLADAMTALPLALAFTIGRRPPNRRYTYGYGRAEDLAGVAIVAVIALSSLAAGYESLQRLLHPRPVHHLVAVAVASVIGFVGNEWVAAYRIRVGRAIGSAALVADGMHARTDGLTSLAVLIGAIGVGLGWPQADPVVGLVITLAILVVLRSAARDVYHRLMDAVSPQLVSRVERVLADAEGVCAVGEVRIRWIGHALRAEAAVEVDATLTVAKGHAIVEAARHRLLHDVPRLADALLHADPADVADDPHAAAAHHTG